MLRHRNVARFQICKSRHFNFVLVQYKPPRMYILMTVEEPVADLTKRDTTLYCMSYELTTIIDNKTCF